MKQIRLVALLFFAACLALVRPVGAAEASDSSPLATQVGGVDIKVGGWLDDAVIFRDRNTGNTVGTQFGLTPFINSIAGNLTELRMSGQLSALNFRAHGKVDDNNLTGFVEMDFNGNQAGSIFVESNSLTPRLRLGWLQWKTGDLEVLAGQDWSLLTPSRKGISPETKDQFLGKNIDSNYMVGLSWSRQAQVRFVYHASESLAFGIAAENPEQYTAGEVTYPIHFNAQLGGQFDSGSLNTTPNLMPDVTAKVAVDGQGYHVDLFGLLTQATIDYLSPLSGNFVNATQWGWGAGASLSIQPLDGLNLVGTGFGGWGTGRYLGGLGPGWVVLPDLTGNVLTPSAVQGFGGIGGVEFEPIKGTTLSGYYGFEEFENNNLLDTTAGATPGTNVGFGGAGSGNTANRFLYEISGDLNQVLFSGKDAGTLQWDAQYSVLYRTPWFVPAGGFTNVYMTMVYTDLKYILP